jgi:hypothetical protein
MLPRHTSMPAGRPARGVQCPTYGCDVLHLTQDAMLLSSAAPPEDGSEGEPRAREATPAKH